MKLSHRCEAQPPKGGAVARNTPFAVTFEPVLVKPSMPEMDSGGSPPPTLFCNSYILYFPMANSMTHTYSRSALAHQLMEDDSSSTCRLLP